MGNRLVERPICEHLTAMGWQWIENDTDEPKFTERANFREELLTGRFTAALRKLQAKVFVDVALCVQST